MGHAQAIKQVGLALQQMLPDQYLQQKNTPI